MKNAIKSIMTRLINIKTKIHSHAYPIYVTYIALEALPAFVLETVCLNRLSFWSYVDGKGLIMLFHGRMATLPTVLLRSM